MRKALALSILCLTVLSCSRSPESTPTAPSSSTVATTPAIGSIRAASWSCGAAAASSQADSPWRIETPRCESVEVRSVASTTAASPVFAPGPTNYRATVVGTSVRLEWDQSPGSYGWQIEAGSAPGLANLAVLRTAPATLGTTATQIFDVANVPPGRYFSRVRSGPPNFSDLSVPSNEIEVIVGSTCGAAPSAPTGFLASVAGANVTLNWVAPAGQSVSSYLLEVGSAAGLSNLLVFDTGSAATTLAATAAPGVYFARLRSRNACGTGAPTPDIQVVIGGGPPPPPPSACAVSLSPPTQTAPTGGATFDLQVSTAANCQWQASLDVPWLSFGSTPSGQGSGTLRVNVASNSGAGRGGRVTVSTNTASAATDISQAGTTACSYVVSPTSFNIIPAGGSLTANVTATAGCTWTAASNSGFITISSGASGNGNGAVVLQIANNTGAARTGSARVSWAGGGQDLTVSQSSPPVPPTAAFSASPDPCLLTNNGNTLNCSFNGSASLPGSGTITAWVWQYLTVNQEESGPTHSPTAFTNCGIGPNQQVAVPVTLRVRNSDGLLSPPVQQTVTLRRQGACGF